jgi:hypothetical protein
MNDIVRKDALEIFNRVIDILEVKEDKDILELKELSNHTIHNSSVFQDVISVSTAVLVYSLSKVIERSGDTLSYGKILSLLKDARKNLDDNEEEKFNEAVKGIFSEISAIDSKLKLYIQEVINQAQVRKGYNLYKHGLSSAKAAEIFGVSQWDLMDYAGKTKLSEFSDEIIDVRTRLKLARSVLS